MKSVSRAAALVAILFAQSIAAQPAASGGTSESASITPPPDGGVSRPRVLVTSVGILRASELERALGPTLRSSYILVFSSADRFGPTELFAAREESSATVHVWVDTTAPERARLYFADRDGTRYLVRDLALSSPIDELDSESLAQAIEWSLQALVEGDAGMTRAEAHALFLPDPEPREAKGPPLVSPQPACSSSTAWRRETTGWMPALAVLQGWTLLSSEFPAVLGPVLRVGLDRLTPHHQIGVTLSGQYQYPQRHARDGLALELQSLSSRIDARYLATDLFEGSAFGLRLGLGLDVVFSSPEALNSSRFQAMEPGVRTVPLITGGLIWQWRVEPSLRLELSVGAELDLTDLHYDVVTGDESSEFVSRWPARPSASFGVELF